MFACSLKSSGGGKRSSVFSRTSRSFSCSTCSVASLITNLLYRARDLEIGLPGLGAVKHRGAGYEHAGPDRRAARSRAGVDPAVDLEREPGRQDRPQPLELGDRVLDELLAAPA